MTSNMTHDAYGREWADHSKMRPGTSRVTHDGGARCLPTGELLVLTDENARLYVECSEGRHYLDGHIDDGHHVVGFYDVTVASS